MYYIWCEACDVAADVPALVNQAPSRKAWLMTKIQHGSARTALSADEPGPDELADRYASDGYVVLPGAFTAAEVAELRTEALRICRGELGAVAGMEPGPPGEPETGRHARRQVGLQGYRHGRWPRPLRLARHRRHLPALHPP